MYISHLYKFIHQQPRGNAITRVEQDSALYHPLKPGYMYDGEIGLGSRKEAHQHGFLLAIRASTYSLLSFRLRVLNALADYKLIVVMTLQKPVKDAHHDAARYLQL